MNAQVEQTGDQRPGQLQERALNETCRWCRAAIEDAQSRRARMASRS